MAAPALYIAALFAVSLLCIQGRYVDVRSCTPITIDLCMDIGYNVTGMPNVLGHESQNDADIQIQTFSPLIKFGCSRQLRFFLCSVHVPMCTEKVPELIGPCRPMCETVRHQCQPVLHKFGFPWPEILNCSRFPAVNREDSMCMEKPEHEQDKKSGEISGSLPHTPLTSFKTGNKFNTAFSNNVNFKGIKTKKDDYPSLYNRDVSIISDHRVGHACHQLAYQNAYFYLNRTGKCSLYCDGHYVFTQENKRFAEIWMAVWSCLCFVCTLFAIATMLIDSKRVNYPERVFLFLSICYAVISIAYIVRLLVGRDAIACHSVADDFGKQHRVLLQEGLEITDCALVFLLSYYFLMAGTLWWVLLSLAWSLIVSLKWNQESMARHITYFHLIAWALPAVKTIVILVTRHVDVDELTGVCFIGNQRPNMLLGFVIGPLVAYLGMGTLFLLVGFCALVKNKKSNKKRSTFEIADKTGIFAAMFIIPSLILVACWFYQFRYQSKWYSAVDAAKPNVDVIMLRIFVSLFYGVLCGAWMCSKKSLSSWKNLMGRVCSVSNHKKHQVACNIPTCCQATQQPLMQGRPKDLTREKTQSSVVANKCHKKDLHRFET